jgi:hypothetical protein
MNFQNIFLVGIIILLLYLVVSFFYAPPSSTPMTTANTTQTVKIPPTTLEGTSNSSNNTYSIWFYINDYSSIQTASITSPTCTQSLITSSAPSSASPTTNSGILFFQKDYINAQFFIDNTLRIMIANACATPGNNVNLISITNIPVQKWTHLLVTTTPSTVDCYVDGKLNYTVNLVGSPSCNITNDVIITPANAFNGYTAMFQYKATTINPQEAWDIYSNGYGDSMYSNMFGKYTVQMSILDNGEVTHSLTI